MHVVIDRSKWRCGGEGVGRIGEGSTELLNKEGYMCCLGFACLRAGLSKKTILRVARPDSEELVIERHRSVPQKLTAVNLYSTSGDIEWVNKAINNNDSKSFTPKEREYRIKQNFKTGGHTVEFVGEYEK